jgi:hypothetical protein
MDSWTPSRMALRDHLARLSGELEGLFAYAVDLVGQPLSRHQLTMLAHAVRELVNNSAEVLLAEGQRLPSRSDVGSACEALHTVWMAGALSLPEEGNADASSEAMDMPRSLVTVPYGVWMAAGRVVMAQAAGSGNAQERYAAAATGRPGDRDHPTTRLSARAMRFFRPWFHLPRREMSLPAQQDVDRHFGMVEAILRTRAAAFFSIVDELEDLLVEANATEADAGMTT